MCEDWLLIGLVWMQIIFAAEILVIEFALLEHNPEIYVDEVSSVAGVPDRQIVCKANSPIPICRVPELSFLPAPYRG